MTLVVCVRLMCVYFGLFSQRIDLYKVSSILIRYLLAMSRDVCIARTRRSARPCLPLWDMSPQLRVSRYKVTQRYIFRKSKKYS